MSSVGAGPSSPRRRPSSPRRVRPSTTSPANAARPRKGRPMSEDPKTYEVGYGRPPLHSRFIKGQSGNPSGRKKGLRTLRTIVEEEGEVIIRIIENGRRRK